MLCPTGLQEKELLGSPRSTFFPIHSDHHWSFFVVVNPLLIPVLLAAGEYQHPDDLDIPALVMRTSFKLHNGNLIVTYIWQWLGHDWSRSLVYLVTAYSLIVQ
jgi:hypothetical protein